MFWGLYFYSSDKFDLRYFNFHRPKRRYVLNPLTQSQVFSSPAPESWAYLLVIVYQFKSHSLSFPVSSIFLILRSLFPYSWSFGYGALPLSLFACPRKLSFSFLIIFRLPLLAFFVVGLQLFNISFFIFNDQVLNVSSHFLLWVLSIFSYTLIKAQLIFDLILNWDQQYGFFLFIVTDRSEISKIWGLVRGQIAFFESNLIIFNVFQGLIPFSGAIKHFNCFVLPGMCCTVRWSLPIFS